MYLVQGMLLRKDFVELIDLVRKEGTGKGVLPIYINLRMGPKHSMILLTTQEIC